MRNFVPITIFVLCAGFFGGCIAIPSGGDADHARTVCQELEKHFRLPEKPHPDNGIGVYWSIHPFYTEISVQGIFTTPQEQAQVIRELKLIHNKLGGPPVRVFFYLDGNERKHLIQSVYIK